MSLSQYPARIKAKIKRAFSWKYIHAKIEPQLHWKVPFEAGIYENSPKWSNKGTALNNLSILHLLSFV